MFARLRIVLRALVIPTVLVARVAVLIASSEGSVEFGQVKLDFWRITFSDCFGIILLFGPRSTYSPLLYLFGISELYWTVLAFRGALASSISIYPE